MEPQELPLGFGMALAQQPDAMEKFSRFSQGQKDEILRRAHSASSKREMQELVRGLSTFE